MSSGFIVYTEQNPELIKDQDLDNPTDIFLLSIDDLQSTNLTSNVLNNTTYFRPRISPDKTKILFEKQSMETSYLGKVLKSDLYIMDIQGEAIQKITISPMYKGKEDISNLIHEMYGDWSPDGKKVVFSSNRSILEKGSGDLSKLDIFVMDLTNYEIEKITDFKGSNEHPVWSPDGKTICFMSDRYGDWDLFTISLETREIKQLTKSEAAERFPQWSLDGKKIIYHFDIDGNIDLYLLYVNSLDTEKITTNPAADFTASLSPDGNWILFVSDRDSDDEIFMMNIFTKETIQITKNQVLNGVPDWVP